jgi:hypothetical protein
MHSVFVVCISLSVFRETHIMYLIQPCLSSEEQLLVGRGGGGGGGGGGCWKFFMKNVCCV